MNGDGKRVLLVYYTFTQQTGSVINVMAGASRPGAATLPRP
jgi:hypothetical protein